MDIKVINKSDNDLPIHATEQAAGLDLKAYLRPDTEYVGTGFSYDKVADVMYLFSGGRVVIPTGLHIELPVGYELQIRPRSGLAAKHGITVLNTPGTIDADYRGDIGVHIEGKNAGTVGGGREDEPRPLGKRRRKTTDGNLRDGSTETEQVGENRGSVSVCVNQCIDADNIHH